MLTGPDLIGVTVNNLKVMDLKGSDCSLSFHLTALSDQIFKLLHCENFLASRTLSVCFLSVLNDWPHAQG